MRRITSQNALKLSAWIADQHPALFRQLVAKVGALQRSPAGRLGAFGDDTDLTFTPDLPAIQIAPGVDYESTAAYTPELSDVSLSAVGPADGSFSDSSFSDSLTSAIAAPSTTTDMTAPAESGSFWSGIGSGAASAASAIGKVASALVSPAALTAVGGAAAAYFGMQSKTAQAQTQNAILQSQLARTAAGAPPAAVSYVTNPLTGQLMPVYNTPSGQVPVTGSLLNRLSNPTVAGVPGSLAGIPTTWLLIGGGALLLTLVLSTRR